MVSVRDFVSQADAHTMTHTRSFYKRTHPRARFWLTLDGFPGKFMIHLPIGFFKRRTTHDGTKITVKLSWPSGEDKNIEFFLPRDIVDRCIDAINQKMAAFKEAPTKGKRIVPPDTDMLFVVKGRLV